ncbi:ABC transporter ATP-binding protein [Anaplasma platys]|uniref:ABC transporter ATP-binding protein n=1 Tax=Anaplasma platys TaxID=949 RepID=UPI003977BE33
MNYTLELHDVGQHYAEHNATVFAGVNLKIAQGEFVALIGNSGAGKSTLLHIAGLLQVPTHGTVLINNVRCSPAKDAIRTKIRRANLGFVYQSPNLLHELNVLENVMLPLRILGQSTKKAHIEASAILQELGLEHKMLHQISCLSGGEKQRVALARALVNRPCLLLADEPTGSLDPSTSDAVFSVMYNSVKTRNLSALVVTHNHLLANKSDILLSLQNGKLAKL